MQLLMYRTVCTGTLLLLYFLWCIFTLFFTKKHTSKNATHGFFSAACAGPIHIESKERNQWLLKICKGEGWNTRVAPFPPFKNNVRCECLKDMFTDVFVCFVMYSWYPHRVHAPVGCVLEGCRTTAWDGAIMLDASWLKEEEWIREGAHDDSIVHSEHCGAGDAALKCILIGESEPWGGLIQPLRSNPMGKGKNQKSNGRLRKNWVHCNSWILKLPYRTE